MPRSKVNAGLVTVLLVLASIAVVLVLLLFLARDFSGKKAVQSVSLPTSAQVSQSLPSTVPTSTSTTLAVPDKQVIGTSGQGRPIELHTFGSGKWRVLIIGGIHGNEYGGPIARKFLAYLEAHPDAVPAGVFLQIIPSANPDGEAAHTRANANKVDVNRNFPSNNWSRNLNEGDRPTAGLTGGTAPGSEPETKALLAALKPGWDLVVSLHSSGGIVNLDGKGGQAVAKRISAAWGKPVANLDYQEYITGSLGVYVPEHYHIPVITIELENAKFTDAVRDALLAALPPFDSSVGTN